MPYKYVPVAKEDTYKLIDAAQNGDRRARDLIVDQNIGLVKNLAMRYASGYYEPEDLMQVGFVGLVKAIDRFDTGYNVMFSTYAVPMIMGEIKRYIRDDGKIKIGRQMKTEMKNLKKLQQEYYHKHGVSPRVSWLADKMGISREHVWRSWKLLNLCPASRVWTMKRSRKECTVVNTWMRRRRM